MFCPMCGKKLLAEGMRFCMYCGAEIPQISIPDVAPQSPSETQDTATPPAQNVDIWLDAYGETKIAVIKAIRTLTGMGLRETKELVDSAPTILRENVSLSEARLIHAMLEEAGATVSLRPSGSPAFEPAPSVSHTTGTLVDVELTSFGVSKIAVIKEIRSILECGLVMAKDLVEAAPTIMLSNVPIDEAYAMKARIERAGGIVTLR